MEGITVRVKDIKKGLIYELYCFDSYIPLQFKRLLIYSYTIACRDYSSLCGPSIKWQCRFNSFIRYRCQRTCNVCGKISCFRYYINISGLYIFTFVVMVIEFRVFQIVEDSSTSFCKSCTCFTCLNGGTCSVKNGSPTCTCLSGFTGPHCHFTGRKFWAVVMYWLR